MKHFVRLLGIGVVLSASSVALAQDAPGYQTKDVSDGYQVTFRDDPLAAGGIDPNSATINVRKGPMRATLIRPRVTFVSEMLKSVENL